jgi:uracil phosphoribosyltransferase
MELLGLYLVADPLWWTGRSLSDVIRLILEHGYEKVHGTVMQYVSRYAIVYRYIKVFAYPFFFLFVATVNVTMLLQIQKLSSTPI